MLENAWTTARAWAAEARRQQGSARTQALWTFVLAALAALLAARRRYGVASRAYAQRV